TRFSRDWSSDVCSSDLGTMSPPSWALMPNDRKRNRTIKSNRVIGIRLPQKYAKAVRLKTKKAPEGAFYLRSSELVFRLLVFKHRSEERRVGTEWKAGSS